MKKFLPVVFCGIAAISYSQLTLAGDDYKSKDNSAAGATSSSDARSDTRTPSGAGPTDNPNVTRDAQGREHMNQGKHTGQYKNKKDKDDSYSSGSGSTTERKKDDSYSRGDSTTLPSASGSTSGSASGSASGSTQTQVK
jgi:hypothetical protein